MNRQERRTALSLAGVYALRMLGLFMILPVFALYAGDLEGKLWAFDLSGSNTGNWEVAYKQGSTPKPLFIAQSNQQITSTPVVVRNKTIPTSNSNDPNTLVIFGTGQYLTSGDTTTTHTQAMYGVWDSGTRELDQSDLVRQDISTGTSSGGVFGRTLTDNVVDYTSDDGWYINLPDSGERLVTDPVIRGGLVFFNTMIMATSCCCGKNEAGNKCRGGSNITDKDGSLMAEIWDKEGIIYADVDPGTVLDARNQNPWYRGQRQDLYR